MKPAPLELDYLRSTPRPAWGSWLLLAVTLGFATDVATSYVRARFDVEAGTERLARLSARPARESASGPTGPLSQVEFAAAQDTIQRLSLPWDNVFRALEGARSDDVALLSIEPDSGMGSLTLTGEARSYPAALTYVAWLSREKTLKNVRLARHEIVQNDPRRFLAITIYAEWKDRR